MEKLSHDGFSHNGLGVAFLKEVPEGTYDAVIVDSSDPIGIPFYSFLLFCDIKIKLFDKGMLHLVSLRSCSGAF